MLRLSDTDRGWLAGLLEGEGCFATVCNYTRKDGTKTLSPCVSLSMTDKDVVERAASLIGFTGSIHVRKRKNHTWKPLYVMQAKGTKALEVMATVQDLMGTRRREKITEVMAVQYDRRNKSSY